MALKKMATNSILFIVLIVSYQCNAGLLDGILSGAHTVHSKVHDVAASVLGGLAQGANFNIQGQFGAHGQRPQNNPGRPGETVTVVVVEQEPDRNQNQPGYRPQNPTEYRPYNNNGGHSRPNQHTNQYNPHQNTNNQNNPGYGNENGYGTGNWNGNQPGYGNGNQHNNGYGNGNQPNNGYGNGNQPNNGFGNGNQHNNGYGNGNQPNNGYGNGERPNNGYGNGDRPNNEYGNGNGNQVNNGYGNNGGDQPNHGNPNQHQPHNQEHTTEYVRREPEQNNPTYGSIYNPSTEHNYGQQTSGHDQHTYINHNEKTTKKPSGDGDGPLLVPLNPNEYIYGGDKVDVTAPKRDTNDSQKKPADDDDEQFPIDIRFQDD